MSTLSLYLLLWQNVHSPIMSPYDKMSTLSHYLPLWQNVDSITLSPLVAIKVSLRLNLRFSLGMPVLNVIEHSVKDPGFAWTAAFP
jgi:hypothetical protein